MKALLPVVAIACLLVVAPQRAFSAFQDLGTLPGGDYFKSQALGVSGDGAVVVGSGSNVTIIPECCVQVAEQAIRWQWGVLTGMKSLVANHQRSIALAASYDGSVITGVLYRTSPWQGGFVWEAGAVTSLGDLPGGSSWSAGRSVSDDGNTIAGFSIDAINERAIRWDAGAMTNLGTGTGWSDATGVSGDGATVVGFQQNEGAKRWDGTVISGLTAPPGDFETRAFGISSDGTAIVGRSLQSVGEVAVRWKDGVPALLGTLPGDLTSVALDASADGSVVVGRSADAQGNRRAFIWEAGSGMRNLQDVLVAQGNDLTGWTLHEASGISDDGLVVVGTGRNPGGLQRGWVARFVVASVPTLAPPGYGLLCALLLGLGLRAGRIRARANPEKGARPEKAEKGEKRPPRG